MRLIDFLFPPRCAHCLTILKKGASCIRCLENTSLNRTLFCGSCRARLPNASPICHPAFPYLLGAAASYEGPIKSLVLALKFALVREAAAELGDVALAYALQIPLPWREFVVVPVPLSKRRFKERGFNQAELIAACVAKGLGVPALPGALTRIRHTRPQSLASSVEERGKNVLGAFMGHSPEIRGKKVILVDDVVTSGATLFAAATALKSAGAKNIAALVPAKR